MAASAEVSLFTHDERLARLIVAPKDVALQPEQKAFIRRVYGANPRIVVVLLSNFSYALPWAA